MSGRRSLVPLGNGVCLALKFRCVERRYCSPDSQPLRVYILVGIPNSSLFNQIPSVIHIIVQYVVGGLR
jgi:hypothetical protein